VAFVILPPLAFRSVIRKETPAAARLGFKGEARCCNRSGQL
jgi:hypothetical protein